MLKNIFKKILYSGAHPELSQEDINRIWLSNFLALTSVFFCLFYNIIYYYFSFYTLFTINSIAILFYLSVLIINRYNNRLAKLFFYVSIVSNIFLASSFFGPNAQIHLLLFPVSLLPFLLIDFKNYKELIRYFAISFIALSVLYVTDFSLFYHNNLSNEFIGILNAASKIFSILGSIIVLFLIVYIQNKSQVEILNVQENLQNQLKSIFDHSFDAIILIEKSNSKIIRANQKAHQLFEVDNMQGLIDFSKKFVLNEKLLLSDLITINKVLNEKGYWKSEAQFVSTKGKVFWGAISIKNITIDNSLAQLIRITDITDKKEIEIKLKESEEKYSGIFNSTPDGVFLISVKNGRFLIEDNNPVHHDFVSPLFGDFKGKYIDEILPPELSKNLISKYLECYNTGNTIKYEEYIQLPDNNNFWFFTILTPIKNANGEVVKILGSSRDITSFKQAEENLKNALKEKEVLLSEIHHRVKNNLAIVSGLLMLQSEKVKHPEDFYLFDESRNRINSMALIHETLYRNDDFSLIDFNKYLVDLIKNIKNSYQLKNKVSFSLNIENVVLPIDIALPLGLLVNEILTNSFKHAFNFCDNPELKIDFIKAQKEHKLYIKDNGPGFDFDKFKNNDNSLGASLIFSLAEQINASMEYVNENGSEYQIKFIA
ncbi:MAG: histidine kinase dimerization/phosphoacceptor domain -containing protein [Bacteroidia bacterium]